jgi:hypothetical protein
MTDRYTKAVLTVIAVALVAIVVQNGMRNASAQLGGGCGNFLEPCYVKTGGGLMDALEVRIVGR